MRSTDRERKGSQEPAPLRWLRERLLERLRPPTRRAWLETALAAGAFALAAFPVARATGLLPLDGSAPLWRLAALLVVPALAEETLYRGLLLPRRPARPLLAALPQLALYVAAHPLVAHTVRRPAVGVFTTPTFLLLTLLLGGACTLLVLRWRSLWPAVALHAFVVVGWGIGGGLPPLG